MVDTYDHAKKASEVAWKISKAVNDEKVNFKKSDLHELAGASHAHAAELWEKIRNQIPRELVDEYNKITKVVYEHYDQAHYHNLNINMSNMGLSQ